MLPIYLAEQRVSISVSAPVNVSSLLIVIVSAQPRTTKVEQNSSAQSLPRN